MDPNATLSELRQAIPNAVDGDNAESVRAAELFQALDDWLSRGGFLPEAWDTDRARHGFVAQPVAQEFCAAPDDQDSTDQCGLHRRAHNYEA